ncbi:hypothetical protein B0H15DRAFT_127697 [Mycena belliarum]|uniref:Transmembrane protein n=1 Tax=Mycena belliarum TaxID=1033014 RepID=A0AAD6U8V0_9AGAR|nr:hypothetical protein B0H15DRAFT_127697 [Mycena belliae]
MSTSLNITVLDQSPTWIYTPDREGLSSSSWESAWTGSADSSYDATHTQANIAQGVSVHTSSLPGASAQISFVGSAVTIYGQGSAGAYSTTLDGGKEIAGAPSGSVLASYGGLSDAAHSITLKVTKSQPLSLSYATFTIRTALQASSVQNSTVNAVLVGENNTYTTNSFFSTSGSGGFSNDHADQNVTRLDTNSAGATISFTCSNTSVLFIYGTTNWDHQTFSVSLDPPAGASQGARIFNGTSKWFVLNNLIFWEGGLDSTQSYTVKLQNLNGGSYTDIHSVVMMNLPASPRTSNIPSSSGSANASGSKSSGVGKTVAIAVGAVVAIAAVILLVFICFRRRAKKRREHSTLTLDAMVTTPFVDTDHSPLPSTSSTSEDPRLSHKQTPSSLSGSYPNSYSMSQYPSSSSSAGSSVQDPRDRAPGTRYSEVPTGDFNVPGTPYTALPSPLASSAALSPRGSSQLPYSTRPEKGRIPSDAPSSRPVRQEVDAGRAPAREEEVLPPNYDPTWAGPSLI